MGLQSIVASTSGMNAYFGGIFWTHFLLKKAGKNSWLVLC